ncbi:HAD-IA family hydrolase [Candidatus Saccharibacteria bacterium]|nr:HAD-IA family hydrolase [Candidatus Saccharibacteria bacterium]
MDIKAVGFDYIGVTAHLNGPSIFDVVGEITGHSFDEVKAVYGQHNAGFQVGSITKDQLWSAVASELDASGQIDKILAAAAADLPVVDPEMLAFVDKVRAAGYKTGLLSNLAPETPWDEGMRAAGVPNHFDVVMLSGDVGLAKPDPNLYRLFAGQLGVDTHELIFTDDRQASLAGVEFIGVRPIVFENLAQLKAQLTKLGVKL